MKYTQYPICSEVDRMASSNDHEMGVTKSRLGLSREKMREVMWKVAAAALVVFLIYVMLHFGSQLIELQGG